MPFKRSRSLKNIVESTIEQETHCTQNAGTCVETPENIVALSHFLELIQQDEKWKTVWSKCKYNLDVPKTVQEFGDDEEQYIDVQLPLPEILLENEIPSIAFRISSTCWALFQSINASKFKIDANTTALTEIHEVLYRWASDQARVNGKALVALAQKLHNLKSYHGAVAILWALALADYKVPGSLAEWASPAKNFAMYRQELDQASFGVPFVGLLLKDLEFSSVVIFLDDDLINLSQLSTFYDNTVKVIEKFQQLNGKTKPRQLSKQRSLLGSTMKLLS
mmetsp:Transcript_8280/g.11402  ORF Transcript_8280/g.11402 Transcript_8280/m.11402 type:complete len:279 (-) Transcript_8280:60-896(-)